MLPRVRGRWQEVLLRVRKSRRALHCVPRWKREASPYDTPSVQHQSRPKTQKYARDLRRAMTEAETRLWSHLRGEQLGVKFRRQHPLGHYIADFACLAPKLIVEVDGSQHSAQQDYDTCRDEFFYAKGFEVLRFPANAPFLNLQGVLQTIATHLQRLNTSQQSIRQPALPL